MGLVLGKVGEDVPMLLALLLKLVGEVAVLVLSAVTVLFGVGLASPALPVVLDGVELPHIIMFLKLRSKIGHSLQLQFHLLWPPGGPGAEGPLVLRYYHLLPLQLTRLPFHPVPVVEHPLLPQLRPLAPVAVVPVPG